ncbi:MAG: long-chain-fatty-acid--CoA ligase [Dehalococcoidia bacterium]
MEVPMLVSDFLHRAVELYGDLEGVVCGDERFSYAEFNARVNRLANALGALNIAKGDRVAILSPNCHRFLEAFYGVAAVGGVLVPLNYRLLPSDFTYIANHAGASVFLVDDELVSTVDEIRPRLGTVRHYVSWGGETREGWLGYEDLLAAASDAPAPDPRLAETDIATINYTSGTTARPKGVMMTHRNLYANAWNTVAHIGVERHDVLLHTLPMFHANGWGTPFSGTGMGVRHVVLRKVDGADIFRLIQDEGVTWACMAPAVLSTILNFPDKANYTLTTTPRLVVAGAPPPAAFIKRLREELGWTFIQVYGLTETAPFLTICELRPEMESLPMDEQCQILARAGIPMIGVGLKVVNQDGTPVAADDEQVGEVLAQSNVVMKGYWRQPGETDKAIENGWFHTGDLATVNGLGYINIVDRAKDVIISGGENISSIEVEDTLYKHPGVLECAVVGVPSEKWGETPKALIVPREGFRPSEAEIIAFCREHMAHFKAPTTVELIEQLPRTATGKLQKYVLRDKYWGGQKRRVN